MAETSRSAVNATPLLALLLAAAAVAAVHADLPAPLQQQDASCYDFSLGTKAGGSFSEGAAGQLPTNGIVSGWVLYGVVHRCEHGILFPYPEGVRAVAYYVDDSGHSKPPAASRGNVAPHKLSTADLAAGQHSLTVVITYDDSALYRPLVRTRSFKVPAASSTSEFEQCGGRGGSCGGAAKACADKAWSAVPCTAGLKCRRQSAWFWQCLK